MGVVAASCLQRISVHFRYRASVIPGIVIQWWDEQWGGVVHCGLDHGSAALSEWRIVFFQAEDGIRDYKVTGVQTCALPICKSPDWLLVLPASEPSPSKSEVKIAPDIPLAGEGRNTLDGSGLYQCVMKLIAPPY